MSLIAMRSCLSEAQARGYAVGAFNVTSMDSLMAIADAAVEAHAPVFFAVCEVHFPHFRFDALLHAVCGVAESMPVPAVMHLDHGYTFPALVKAIRAGFNSVMFDGSALPFEENIARTKQIVDVAHAVGVQVEAELGNIGGAEGAGPGSGVALTDPDKAVEFVERTECDTLAVAIGTAHGVYKSKPQLDFDRLAVMRRKVPVPLVLHGGTGVPDDDIRHCIALGISKINVYTQLNLWAAEVTREQFTKEPGFADIPQLLLDIQARIKAGVMECMKLFGCAGQAASQTCTGPLDPSIGE